MWPCAALKPSRWGPDMAKIELGAAVFVHGEPHAIGDILDLDSGTAEYLIRTGKATAVVATEQPAEQPAKPPAQKPARKPTPAPKED